VDYVLVSDFVLRDDDSSREATGLAKIRASREDYLVLSHPSSGRQRAFIRIRVGSEILGAAVDAVDRGALELLVDQLLRFDLGLLERATVVERLEPVECEKVEVALSSGELSTEVD
jgi:hypothetical protein